ncbi:FKBP-type peptidyl-prolyl cis-trans isomerase [Mucilaginibacter sp.]|uniref:FKBP-type peptidyl-prolyl cis-trans isomerase n=1 Tax=Mucilaginibacter sp. TaxID=1882438 RepID=UPI0025EB3291|nr:FKBP-type peptidyl-prolyl cis-trans isomerase [Mucilaginibacter sp.]
MKHRFFTFLLIAFAALTACKKNDQNELDIKQYDDQQIQSYMTANSLTGFTKDTTTLSDGNSGIYYKIIGQGKGDTLKYSDQVSIVYTIRSMDGKFAVGDTIANRRYDFLGPLTNPAAITGFALPSGLQLAIHNILKYKGSSMRVLIPSRLAYGTRGYGSGSITNTNTRIAGNQSLDIYVNVIKDQNAYDDLVIRNYLTANNVINGYTKDPLGYYYKVITPGTGTVGEIGDYSNVSMTYAGSFLNGVYFDNGSITTAATFQGIFGAVTGFKDPLKKYAATGTSLSVYIPSSLGYGVSGYNTIPPNSILHFEMQVTQVTQP